MDGLFLRQGDQLLRMRETEYEREAVLQELLERHPEVLAGGSDDGSATWLLIKREAHVALGEDEPLRGMLDHLFLDADGVPTLVDVKRSSDTRIRREVVGQLLDYAADGRAFRSSHSAATASTASPTPSTGPSSRPGCRGLEARSAALNPRGARGSAASPSPA